MSKASLLEVKNLSLSFNGTGDKLAVNDVSFSLNKGELMALVGESGSGKSVSALSIMQLHRKHSVHYPSGSILFNGEELMGAGEATMRTVRGAEIGMIFQEPMSALNPLHFIGKQIAEMISYHQPSYSKSKVKERINELLDLVGMEAFKDRLDAYPHQLSGGERQRIIIAIAIANNPDLLIADEPTTALDVSLRNQIMELLQSLQKKLGMAILLITHDLPLVKRVADKIAIMQQGKIVEQGVTADIFANPSHSYTKKLLSSEPKGKAINLAKDSPEILSCEKLRVSFTMKKSLFGKVLEEKHAVDNTSLTLKKGETLGIVGESGSGKTTLGLALLRLMHSNGEIIFDKQNISELSTKLLQPYRKRMQFVFQDPFASLNPRLTVGGIIGEGLKTHEPNLSKSEWQKRVDDILIEVGLRPNMSNRYPHEFSGGQRQRINIARAMILNPELVVLDEPTSALDLSLQSQILDLLKKFQTERGTSYLFITHDLRVIKAISHKIIVIRQGKIIEHGSADEIFTKPQKPYTKELIAASFD